MSGKAVATYRMRKDAEGDDRTTHTTTTRAPLRSLAERLQDARGAAAPDQRYIGALEYLSGAVAR